MDIDQNSFLEIVFKHLYSYIPEWMIPFDNDAITQIHHHAVSSLNTSLRFTINRRTFWQPVCPNPLDTGHMCIYLYFLSREAVKAGMLDLGDVLFGLNKSLHSIDLYHSVQLGPVVHLEHPVGSVIGKGTYGNYVYIGQNVTIGRTMRPCHSDYPSFGDMVIFTSNVTVVGRCRVGSNVIFASGTYIKDHDIPSNSIIYGRSPNLTVRQYEYEEIKAYFSQMFHLANIA